MKKFLELLVSIALIIFATFLILDADSITNTASIIIGIIIAIGGIGEIISYFKFKDSSMIINGILALIIGIIIVCHATMLKTIFSALIGIFIILSSFEKLYLCNKAFKENNKKIIGYKIFLCISIIIGILCVLGQFIIPDILLRFVGILLWIYGVISCINVFIVGTENDIENIF